MQIVVPTVSFLASLLLTWYGAAVVAGFLIFAFDRRSKPERPSDRRVADIADGYQRRYGANAANAVADHSIAAHYWASRAERELLARVAFELRTRTPVQ
jgi:hypothetical protein